MKKLLLFLMISVGLNAQFNYQAIVKDSDGNPVTNNQVKFKFSLMYQSSTATPVYVEEHELVTPPDGVVNLSVGGGTVVNGTFTDVDWSQSVFMKEELDTGSGYQDMGTRKVTSVPIAEYSKKTSITSRTFVDSNWNLTIGDVARYGSLGRDNIGIGGDRTLKAAVAVSDNIAIGSLALAYIEGGYNNIAIGTGSLGETMYSDYNIAIGAFAGDNVAGSENLILGNNTYNEPPPDPNWEGPDPNLPYEERIVPALEPIGVNKSVFLGDYSLVLPPEGQIIENSVALGYKALVTASNTIQLGNVSVTLVNTSGVVSASGFKGDGSQLRWSSNSSQTLNEKIQELSSLSTSVSSSSSVSFTSEYFFGEYTETDDLPYYGWGGPGTPELNQFFKFNVTRGNLIQDEDGLFTLKPNSIYVVEADLVFSSEGDMEVGWYDYTNSERISNISKYARLNSSTGTSGQPIVSGIIYTDSEVQIGLKVTHRNREDIPKVLEKGSYAKIYNVGGVSGNNSNNSITQSSTTLRIGNSSTTLVETSGQVSATSFKGNADEVTLTYSGTLTNVLDVINDLKSQIDQLNTISEGDLSGLANIKTYKGRVFQTNIVTQTSIFTVSYNEVYEQPNWIEYQVRNVTANVERSGDFYGIEGIYTSHEDDYHNNDWDKGHLAPAASFLDSQENLEATFSYLNCALMKDNLNRYEWAQLEGQVRDWASELGVDIDVRIDLFFDENHTVLNTGAHVPSRFLKTITLPAGTTFPNETISKKCFEFANADTNGVDWTDFEVDCSLSASSSTTTSSNNPVSIIYKTSQSDYPIYEKDGYYFNNTICQGTQSELFYIMFPEYNNERTEWNLNPANAGVLSTNPIPNNVTVSFDPLFSGTASLSVRLPMDNGGVTDWFTVPLNIIEETVPPSSLTQLIPPFGDIPLTSPTESTSNTTFFTRSNTDYNDYGALEWRITNINPAGNVSTTGSITIDTGILDWQPGFTGTFDVEVRPISCSDGTFGEWVGSTYSITD